MNEQEIVAFKNILLNYEYYKKQIERLEIEIYYLYSIMSGSTSINYEGMHYAPDPDRFYKVLERKDKLEKKRDMFVWQTEYADMILDELPKEIKKATIECYVKHKRFEDVAKRYNYSPSGLNMKIKSALRRVDLEDK